MARKSKQQVGTDTDQQVIYVEKRKRESLNSRVQERVKRSFDGPEGSSLWVIRYIVEWAH